MSKPAFLVDGHAEKKIIEKLCPGHPIRLINCNGEDVSLTAIAVRANNLIKSFNTIRYPIIILIDR